MADPVLPTSTNNVTTRKLAATISGVWTKIDTKKADKVTPASSGNFASLDGNGNLADSGHKHADYATSTQGGKADTAVQSVKMGSSSGTELKSGTNVVIPTAVATGTSGATSGVMTSDDKKKLNEIAAGAEVNQNAFSNVVVGSTTIAADSKTDSLTLAQGNHITLTPSSADDKVTIATDLSSQSAASGGTKESLVTTGEKYTWNSKQDTVVWHDTYNPTSNKGATKKTVDDAINALDVSNITTNLSASKTLTALSQTDGKIAATASPIQIAESQVTNLVSDLAAKAPLVSPALTGTPTAPTAAAGTSSTQIATTAFVVTEIEERIGSSDALVYKGTITLGTTAPGAFTVAADAGWMYKVVANGTTKRGYVDGVAVEVGDMLICNTDGTAAATSSNYQTIVAKWDFIQTNLDGVVVGPESSTTAGVAGFSDTTGKVIKQLTATEIKAAANLSLVKNQAITVTNTSVSDGTNTFNKYVHPTTTAVSAAAVKVGNDSTGHVVLGDALTKSDVGLGNVANTGDSATPVSGGTTKFTTGGAYTELNKKVDKVDGKGLSTNDYTTAEKTKLAGIAEGAEVNQNAFSNVKVGNTTVAADTKTDTVEFVGSGHVTITGDATNDKVTFSTDLESKAAASGGTDVSLVTTGEKYTWNSKASGTHTHTTSIAGDSSSGTVVSLAANTQYKLTAGGTSVLFKTPADSDTHRAVKVNGTQALGNNTTALDLIAGNNVSITDGGSGKVTIANTYAHPTYTAADAAAKKIGRDATGHVVIGSALVKGDVGLGNVDNTSDATKKTNFTGSVASGDTGFPTGDAVYQAINSKVTVIVDWSSTYADVVDIINAGKLPVFYWDSRQAYLPLNRWSGDSSNPVYWFYSLRPENVLDPMVDLQLEKLSCTNVSSGSPWTQHSNMYMQNIYRKVTSWSSTTTDVNYPSEKLVKDSLDAKASSTHTHGSITNDGKIGSTSGYAVYTTTGGALTAGTLATSDPTASGNALSFIDTISQDAKGKITATKKSVTVDSTYSSTGTNPTNGKAIAAALGTLDATVTSSDGTNVQVKVTETDGKVTAVNITTDNTENKSNKVTSWSATTTDAHYPSEKLVKTALDGKAASSHTHGNIQNGGTLQTNDVAIASGDKLVITDYSDSNKVARASTAFDGSTITKALTQKGTFENFAKQADIDQAIEDIPTLSLVGDNHITITSDDTTGTVTIATDLDAQTPYSAKGSATKVPQITTNSLGQVTGITEVTITGVTPASHVHGNITNDGKITASGVTLASGDSLVIVDSSDSSKVAKTSITFDGSTATQALTKKGTWETFNNYVHPTTAGNKHIPSGGASGNILGWSADGTATWIANTSASRGQGYSATATNSSGTFAVTLSGYELVDGGIVSIKFSAAVPANAKLNINSKGAKSIYYRGSALTADIIQSGDTATFMYNSSSGVYHLIAVDRSAGEMTDQEVADLLDALT